jgi:hypothetical protein
MDKTIVVHGESLWSGTPQTGETKMMDKRSAQEVIDGYIRGWIEDIQNATLEQYLKLLVRANTFFTNIPETLHKDVYVRFGNHLPIARRYTQVSKAFVRKEDYQRLVGSHDGLTTGPTKVLQTRNLQKDSKCSKILDFVESSDGVNSHDVAVSLHLSPPIVIKYLAYLAKTGRIRKVPLLHPGRHQPRFQYRSLKVVAA